MTVLAIVLGFALAGAIAAIVSLAVGRASDAKARVADAKAHAEQLTDERVKHTATNGELERTKFQLQAKTDALTHAELTIEILAKESPDDPNRDLLPTDARTRAVRAAIKAKAAAARREGGAPADAAESVHPPIAADPAPATEVPPVGPLDPNESLL